MAIGLLDPRVDVMIDMVQPVDLLNPLVRDLEVWWLALPGTMGGRRFMDIMNPGPNRNHGTLDTNMNPVSAWSGTNRPGGFGELAFDGGNDRVDVPKSPSLDMGSGDFTVIVWFKTLDTSVQTIVGNGGIGTGGKRYILTIPANDTVQMQVDDNSAQKIISSTATYVDGVWRELTGLRDNSVDEIRLYVNAIEANTPRDVTGLGDLDSSRGFSIGSNLAEATGNPGSFFGGSVDSIRVFRRTLSVRELVEWHNLGLRGYPGLLNRIERRVFAGVSVGVDVRRHIIPAYMRMN